MLPSSTTDTLAQATAVAAIVTMLIGILRPFVEQLPFARPSAPTHDATLRLLNLLLNVGGVLAIAQASGGLSGAAWLALTIQALAQASGSHILFHSVTSSAGASSASSAAPAAPAPAVVPVTSSAQSPAIASASEVAAAINAALASAATAQHTANASATG